MSYWDASALLSAFVTQAGSTAVRALAADDTDTAAAWHTPVEVWSGVARLVREELLTEDEAAQAQLRMQQFQNTAFEVEMTERLRDLAGALLRRHPLRAGDALHLAAALVWAGNEPQGRGFVCLDDQLRDAAAREGFTVLPAG